MQSDSGEHDSPLSSPNTVTTHLSSSSLFNSSKETCNSLQLIYAKVEAVSSDSQESLKNGSVPSKPLLHSTCKQNANNNAFFRVSIPATAEDNYVDYDSDKSSLNSSNGLSKIDRIKNIESKTFDSSCSDSTGHFQFHLNEICVESTEIRQDDESCKLDGQTMTEELDESEDLEGNPPNENDSFNSEYFQIHLNKLNAQNAEIEQNDDFCLVVGQSMAENSNEAKDQEENLPNENYFDEYIPVIEINESPVLVENCDSLTKNKLPSKISQGKHENDFDKSKKLDDYQTVDKALKWNDFCAQKAQIKQTNGKNIGDICELYELNNEKEVLT